MISFVYLELPIIIATRVKEPEKPSNSILIQGLPEK